MAKAPPRKQDGPAPGQPAPEIEGEDIDGKSFKLSDYRGKVVMLDFWGNW
jgi:peroxiredoxin